MICKHRINNLIICVQEEEEKFKLKSNELLHMRTLHILGQKDGQHPGDQAFSSQVESTSEQCQTLRQQVCPYSTLHMEQEGGRLT